MFKRITGSESKHLSSNEHWLKLDDLAQVEVTSEDAEHPIESALLFPNGGSGWRAGESGAQTVRLVFHRPQKINRVHVMFREQELARTQEFSICLSSDGGHSYRELVRQQYNFGPPHTTEEREDYSVDIDRVTSLELNILPDINGGSAYASLAQLCIA